MPRGRKPKPPALKALEGNRGKRKTRGDTVAPDSELPERPAHLVDRAAEVWDATAEELNQLGLLTKIDTHGFAELCTAVALSEKAQEKLQEMGEVIEVYGEDDEGEKYLRDIRRNPWMMIWKQADEVIVRIMAEFGMTPSSRSRVSASKKKKKSQTPLEEWLVIQGGKKSKAPRSRASSRRT